MSDRFETILLLSPAFSPAAGALASNEPQPPAAAADENSLLGLNDRYLLILLSACVDLPKASLCFSTESFDLTRPLATGRERRSLEELVRNNRVVGLEGAVLGGEESAGLGLARLLREDGATSMLAAGVEPAGILGTISRRVGLCPPETAAAAGDANHRFGLNDLRFAGFSACADRFEISLFLSTEILDLCWPRDAC